MPVDEIIVDALGMQGDSHAGAWNRQISLLSSESILRFQEKTAVPLTYGSFAENLTTAGLSIHNVVVMDRFLVNDVMLEVTQTGKKCHGGECSIFKQIGECIMPKEGIFCRVLHGGVIRPMIISCGNPARLKYLELP